MEDVCFLLKQEQSIFFLHGNVTKLSVAFVVHIDHSFVIAFLHTACSKCGTFGDLMSVLRGFSLLVILLNMTVHGPVAVMINITGWVLKKTIMNVEDPDSFLSQAMNLIISDIPPLLLNLVWSHCYSSQALTIKATKCHLPLCYSNCSHLNCEVAIISLEGRTPQILDFRMWKHQLKLWCN